MITAISNTLRHPAFLAMIPMLTAIWLAHRALVKKQDKIMVNVNGNTTKLLEKIDELVALLVSANETIARLEKALGHKEGEEEAAGQLGKSKNGGGH